MVEGEIVVGGKLEIFTAFPKQDPMCPSARFNEEDGRYLCLARSFGEGVHPGCTSYNHAVCSHYNAITREESS